MCTHRCAQGRHQPTCAELEAPGGGPAFLWAPCRACHHFPWLCAHAQGLLSLATAKPPETWEELAPSLSLCRHLAVLLRPAGSIPGCQALGAPSTIVLQVTRAGDLSCMPQAGGAQGSPMSGSPAPDRVWGLGQPHPHHPWACVSLLGSHTPCWLSQQTRPTAGRGPWPLHPVLGCHWEVGWLCWSHSAARGSGSVCQPSHMPWANID